MRTIVLNIQFYRIWEFIQYSDERGKTEQEWSTHYVSHCYIIRVQMVHFLVLVDIVHFTILIKYLWSPTLSEQ